MPLTPAEKQRKYREKLKLNNPEKYEDMKKKNAERTKMKKKKVAECTEKEKEAKRQKWREEKIKKRVNEQVKNYEQENKRKARCRYQQVYRRNIKLQNTIDLQKKRIKKLQKQLNRYRAKCQRLTQVVTNLTNAGNSQQINQVKINQAETPNTKTNSYVEEFLSNVPDDDKQKVKKQIFEHNVLIHSLTEKYNSGSNEEKVILKSIVENETVKKYKLKTKMASFLGLKGKIRRSHEIKKKRSKLLKKLKDFYERDDVSRATAGKKEVKTFKKDKRQRRYLLQPLRLLYKKYKSENGAFSYSTFKKYRPFYILPPKLNNRDTCACVRHENMAMKLNKLNSLGLTEIKRTEDLLPKIMCDINNKDCAYNNCNTCKSKLIEFKDDAHIKEDVFWEEWILQNYEYTTKDAKKKKTKRMMKKEVKGTVSILKIRFNEELLKFKKHCYNITHQYKMQQKILKKLGDDTVAVHIDFSENYVCKHSKEVQAMHFGASKVQVTLHTGVLYVKEREPITFCTISACNNHGPDAIWAHLDPILKLIKQDFPKITGIHFFSDGPTSQYKQKKNFYFFQKITKDFGFVNSTWNFFEAAHGKGAADGVGGAVKRILDKKVAYGEDISDAETAFHVLEKSDTRIKIFYIPESTIKETSIELTPIVGTTNIHQIRNTATRDSVAYRDVSCFCSSDSPVGYCECFNIKIHNLKLKSKRKLSTAHENIKKKKAKVNQDVDGEESYCDSNYSEHNSSEDESYDQWKQQTINCDDMKVTVQKSLKPLKKCKDVYVILKYDDDLYPGIILSVNEEGALVRAMKKALKSWKWPEKHDELLYPWDDILGCIEEPKLLSTRGRGLYSVPELATLEI